MTPPDLRELAFEAIPFPDELAQHEAEIDRAIAEDDEFAAKRTLTTEAPK